MKTPIATDAPRVVSCNAWLGMETAPTDGTRILALRLESQFVIYYGGANSGWHHNAPGLPSVWPMPTHWMPLPKMPNAGVQEGRASDVPCKCDDIESFPATTG